MTPGTTTLQDAQRASKLFAIDQANRINEQLEKRYHANFDAWKTMVNAGTIPNTNPPMPPIAWVAESQPDGFWYEVRAGGLVCQPRTDIPADHTQPQLPPVGTVNKIQVRAGDPTPVGGSIDGVDMLKLGYDGVQIGSAFSRWKRDEIAGPFGVWRWYERIG